MPIKKSLAQLFLYLIVGALATLVEWAAFYVLSARLSLHYAAATALSFVLSTAANWAFGRLILFKKSGDAQASGTQQSTAAEVAKIYAVSVIGLLLNIAIMAIAVEKIGLSEMVAKILATGIVFAWNFWVRKLVIYKI